MLKEHFVHMYTKFNVKSIGGRYIMYEINTTHTTSQIKDALKMKLPLANLSRQVESQRIVTNEATLTAYNTCYI